MSETKQETTTTTIKQVFCYPIKSCKGIQLEQAWLGKTGIIFDRHWMIVDSQNRFVTQREQPRLSLISVQMPLEILSGQWGEIPEDACLTVSAPDSSVLCIPLNVQKQYTIRKVTCWEWQGNAIDEGDEVAEWFSNFIQKPVRLVRYAGGLVSETERPMGDKRPVDPRYAPNAEVAFGDGFPILLTNTASLDFVNKEAGVNLPMNRFRPNIVVSTCQAFQEDEWDFGITNSEVRLRFCSPCSRCKITTINQSKGEVSGREPLKTLLAVRSGKVLGWSDVPDFKMWKNQSFFGWNLEPVSQGKLSVGDQIQMYHRQQKFPY
eukprot:TRINITY_DN79363_c0_g2_i8.p1 TRINITY_DN79363_c0_g2~~TRINITY_DN79363_c0_g2_i8.p1  ORF type:complete len:342 (+),score=18.70 TRINITY_DN79363_c0_g2_i8:68-1027(+)